MGFKLDSHSKSRRLADLLGSKSVTFAALELTNFCFYTMKIGIEISDLWTRKSYSLQRQIWETS